MRAIYTYIYVFLIVLKITYIFTPILFIYAPFFVLEAQLLEPCLVPELNSLEDTMVNATRYLRQ